jgi:cholesterol oxidase
VRVQWPDVAEQPFARTIDDKMLELTTQVGGTYVKNPRAREFLGDSLITVHPLGGCAMADDAAHGVVNVNGEVFGHEGKLFVADGSILPGPVGVNPALTIAALAEHIADGIVRGWQS